MTREKMRRARLTPGFAALLFTVALVAFGTPSSAQVPPCGDGNLDAGEQCDDGPANGQPASFCTADCTIRLPSVPPCGDGSLDSGEDCDEGAANGNDGSCCTAECTFRAAATPCRDVAGVCDQVDTCSGTSGTCVDDKSTAVCRPTAGVCDVAESCDGVGDDCPADDFEPASVECRASAGVCDPAEHCTGSDAACPADAKSTAVCRGSAGICDSAEICDGAGDDCPADAFQPPGVTCRGTSGICDLAEHCTGSSPACPSDAKSTATCRPAAGVCDVAETCDGVGNACPANDFEPASTECRASAGICDTAEHCTGSGAACPADGKSTAVCRPASGVCDAAESCNGVANTCPPDAFQPASVTCRGAAGVCDVAEHCTGSGAACPADSKASGTECRASAGVCDVAETCNGVDADCPADAFQPASVECRADAGQCDVAETCTGSSADCPADSFEPDETPCDDANVCSENDRCIGGVCGGFLQLCGNGTVDGSCLEQCDDGNQTDGDGCDASCMLEPCGPMPLGSCKQLTAAGKAVVLLKHRDPESKDKLLWKYTPGDTTLKSAFGNPLATTTYQLCIYDAGATPSIVASMTIPAGGLCGGKACWKENPNGFKYSNKAATPHGISAVTLRQGLAPGKTKIQVQGRGVNLPMPSLPMVQSPNVTFQLQAGQGGPCWQAVYSTPAFRNFSDQWRDK